MKEQLINQLHSYLLHNHTDLLIALQEDHRLNEYLSTKVNSISELLEQLEAEQRPPYVIEALCLEELTCDLRPSRFSYVREILETEFEPAFRRFNRSGILTYEVINLTGACEPIFEVFALTGANEDDKELRFAVIGMIAEYLES
jgi:hypothetical protein